MHHFQEEKEEEDEEEEFFFVSGFYVTGIATIIWFLFWVFLVYDTPRRHPRIAEEEVSYIESNITIVDKPPTIPW